MTQEYIGTKQITAWPKAGGPKIRVCGNTCHPNQPSCNGYCTGHADHAELLEPQAGYAVKYPDGYVSWSPKEVFEKAYLPMGHVQHLPLFVQRIIGEKVQLDDRIVKLRTFLNDPDNMSKDGIDIMKRQLAIMEDYSSVLAERLAPWHEGDGA